MQLFIKTFKEKKIKEKNGLQKHIVANISFEKRR